MNSHSLQGNDPQSGAGIREIQEHALQDSSFEFPNDSSLENALAGDLENSVGLGRLRQCAEKHTQGTRFDRARLENLAPVSLLC